MMGRKKRSPPIMWMAYIKGMFFDFIPACLRYIKGFGFCLV